MKFFLKQKNIINRGFTLVESLVAISIFTLSLVGILVSLGQGISDTGFAKNKLIAEYLAQEGIEYVRNLRDTYVEYSLNATTGWSAFNQKLINASCNSVKGCYFGDLGSAAFTNSSMPITGIIFTACTSTNNDCSDAPLKYDATNGKYNYTSGANSGFYRKITFTVNSATSAKITSVVSWKLKSIQHSVTQVENIYQWLE